MLKDAVQLSQFANNGPTCKIFYCAHYMCLDCVILAAHTPFATPRFALMPLSFGKKPKTASSL